MIWSDASSFLAMGGYGLYVWGAFGVTAGLMVAEVLSLKSRRRALRCAAAMAAESYSHGALPHEA